jgi:hypothetical protein
VQSSRIPQRAGWVKAVHLNRLQSCCTGNILGNACHGGAMPDTGCISCQWSARRVASHGMHQPMLMSHQWRY